jgi:uncharacterized protein (UPF0297 family)
MMSESNEATRRFSAKEDGISEVALILQEVCLALKEKGYDPVSYTHLTLPTN